MQESYGFLTQKSLKLSLFIEKISKSKNKD